MYNDNGLDQSGLLAIAQMMCVTGYSEQSDIQT